MTAEEKYIEFVNIVCEMLGFDKPIDILKLCQITSDFIKPYEMRIKELEKENELSKAQIGKQKKEEQYKTCPYRSTDMGCDYCDWRDRNLKDEV